MWNFCSHLVILMTSQSHCMYNNLNFKSFNHTDNKKCEIEYEIDPENHFFNIILYNVEVLYRRNI